MHLSIELLYIVPPPVEKGMMKCTLSTNSTSDRLTGRGQPCPLMPTRQWTTVLEGSDLFYFFTRYVLLWTRLQVLFGECLWYPSISAAYTKVSQENGNDE
jgi:hypothetical protein